MPGTWDRTAPMEDPAVTAARQAAAAAAAANPATPAAGAATPAATPPAPAQNPTQMPGFMGQPGPNSGPQGMMPWQGWMQSGGVNPAGWQGLGGNPGATNWQSLGGGPNTSFFGQFQNMLSNGANPTQVNPTSAAGMQSAAQPYEDTAYQQSMRELQPQQAQQTAQFNQQMISQGITPGSAAYQQAQQQLSQQQNDATAQARAQAQTQGLAAQGQAFGQGLSQSQLANTLAGQLLGANTSFANQQLGGNASVMNQLLGGNSSVMNQLLGGNSGIAQQLIGGNASMNAAAQSANAARANGMNNYRLGEDQLAQTGQQADFGNLMQLLGLGSGVTSYNNGLLNQNQQNAQSFMGYMPNGGTGNIDAQSPYNNNYTGQMNGWNYQNQQANSENQAGMSLAMMALLCDRDAKDTIKTFDVSCEEVLRGLPVDLWRYKDDPGAHLHVGTYAQDFNKALGLGERKLIELVDMIGFLLKSAKEQTLRLDRIEQRLMVAGA